MYISNNFVTDFIYGVGKEGEIISHPAIRVGKKYLIAGEDFVESINFFSNASEKTLDELTRLIINPRIFHLIFPVLSLPYNSCKN